VSVERLLSTLLYEGYALYPYTPGAIKNATPTPFGIVYPPVYAAGSPHTFDRARMQLVLEPGAGLAGTLVFLESSGERHQSVSRRVEIEAEGTVEFAFESVQGRVRLATTPLDGGLVRVAMCVHNTTPVPEGLDRPSALRSSLLSTHLVVHSPGGRFASPISPGPAAAPLVAQCDHVNIFPVLATPNDDTVLGATIVLPDHPQIAPESHGDLFDATEIEEALLLHVMALSDAEREQAADPAVRAMIERVATTTPAELLALHGRVTLRDPEQGEREATVDGVTYRRGDTVVLRPGPGRNAQDHLVRGRRATVERIYVDFDGRVQLAVTVDDVPGQDIMRDIRRYLFFRPDEVVHA
jgi:hypothetical protein